MKRKTKDQRRVVLAVTDPVSLILLDGLPLELASQGRDVHVVVGAECADVPGAEVHVIRMTRRPAPLRDLVGVIQWILLLRRLRPTVVMTGTPKAGLLGMLAARLVGIDRRIYVLRGLRLETTTGQIRRLLLWLERLTAWASTDVLAVSASLSKRASELKIADRSKVTVLGSGSSNGVDARHYRPPGHGAKRAARQSLGLEEEQFVVGFVGRLHPDKGVQTIADAMAGWQDGPPTALLLAGSIEDPTFDDRLSDALAQTNVQVLRVGSVQDLTAIYHAMDVLCLPSLREGFPNVVLEAAASAVPAIVSNATGCSDAVVDGLTGWIFATGSASELRRCLNEACRNPDATEERGSAARARVENDFDRPIVWQRLSAFLDAGALTGVARSRSMERIDG